MSLINKIAFTFAVAIVTIVVAIISTQFDMSSQTYELKVRAVQAAESHTSSNSPKHHDSNVPTSNMPMMSDDGYTSDTANELGKQEPSVFQALADVVLPMILPGTAAPHGANECALTDSNGVVVDTVHTDGSCSDL